jgi:uncharacterized oxidoreductase
MRIRNNTVLVIGGSAGIGLEIARLFHDKSNKVIITGRNKDRLDMVTSTYPGITAILSDMTNAKDVETLRTTLETDFPNLNVLINNAATAKYYSVVKEGDHVCENIAEEVNTNFLSVVCLIEKLLPLLKRQNEAAIVNVTSIAAIMPTTLAGYSASKAALRSYTLSLRYDLTRQFPAVKVFELLPPLTNTEFSGPIGGEKGLPPAKVAEELLKAMDADIFEIRVGATEDLYRQFLASPEKAFHALHASRERKG